MLAGVGPAPAVLIVVAADEGWRRQSVEHLAAVDALGVRHGLLAVTRSDLADPGPALAEALDRLAASSLGRVESVVVSGATGAGLPDLAAALDRLVAAVPAPDVAAPVRLVGGPRLYDRRRGHGRHRHARRRPDRPRRRARARAGRPYRAGTRAADARVARRGGCGRRPGGGEPARRRPSRGAAWARAAQPGRGVAHGGRGRPAHRRPAGATGASRVPCWLGRPRRPPAAGRRADGPVDPGRGATAAPRRPRAAA